MHVVERITTLREAYLDDLILISKGSVQFLKLVPVNKCQNA